MPVSQIQNASLASGVPGKANLPTGSVLQVVNATINATFSTSSTTFVATTLSASITPTSSSSKVLILVNGVALSNSTSYQCLQTIYRNNTTNLGSGTGFTFVNLIQDTATSMSCLDSPATTSSTTYTVYIRTNNASGIAYFGDSVGGTFQTSVITLLEIAA